MKYITFYFANVPRESLMSTIPFQATSGFTTYVAKSALWVGSATYVGNISQMKKYYLVYEVQFRLAHLYEN